VVSERFYVTCPLGPGAVDLDGPEAHHLATVCRLRAGDAVILFNGDGLEYPARVASVGRRAVALEILSVEAPARELPFRLEVAAPLPKGDRATFLIEKLTELGVTGFTPLQTARSVVHPHDAKVEKLQRHAVEACKQCGRNVVPQVKPLTSWASILCDPSLPARRLLAHPGSGRMESIAGDVVVAVGPEGGFTEVEV
jgi:16S rRNA (uracil1498-N3)-methyltransferase